MFMPGESDVQPSMPDKGEKCAQKHLISARLRVLSLLSGGVLPLLRRPANPQIRPLAPNESICIDATRQIDFLTYPSGATDAIALQGVRFTGAAIRRVRQMWETSKLHAPR
jgi:hypothetical protein